MKKSDNEAFTTVCKNGFQNPISNKFTLSKSNFVKPSFQVSSLKISRATRHYFSCL